MLRVAVAASFAAVVLVLAAHGPINAQRPAVAQQLRALATPLESERSYDRLLDVIGDARFVLLGESTHGTHEFYVERARITQRLIEEKGFDAVVLEAEWPNMERVDSYVSGGESARSAEEALSAFTEFPRWMWRNREFADFLESLRDENATRTPGERAHLFGMDLYSFVESADAVVANIGAVGLDPEAARMRYACLGRYRDEPERYATRACERPAQEQLTELERLVQRRAGQGAVDRSLLSVLQNARIVKNAE
jgi:erythromycin esterase-like protein